MKIEMIKVEDLKPYENNPRFNDEAVEFVVNSIKEFGFKVPIIIDGNGVIVAGHTRYKASLELGLKEVPCIVADDLSKEQIKAFRLADNKVSEKASWNDELLKQELDELYGILDMNEFGFPVQIENIDNEFLDEPEEEFTQELDEANNYVVLQFYTNQEWDDANFYLELKRVQTKEENPKIRRHGIGRVIDGKRIVELVKKGRLYEQENEE